MRLLSTLLLLSLLLLFTQSAMAARGVEHQYFGHSLDCDDCFSIDHSSAIVIIPTKSPSAHWQSTFLLPDNLAPFLYTPRTYKVRAPPSGSSIK